MGEIVVAVLGGGAAVAIIEGIKEAIAWHRDRKAKKEDKAEEKADTSKDMDARISKMESEISDLKKMVQSLVESQKNLLFDRIKYLCRAYISDGEIDFDDLRGLNALHNSYHNGLGGNGDLDALMKQARALPLKQK